MLTESYIALTVLRLQLFLKLICCWYQGSIEKFLCFDGNNSNISAGSPLNDELICLSKDIPVFSSNRLPWCCPIDPKIQETIFRTLLIIIQKMDFSRWLLSNSVYELDSSACELIPNILSIGPLLASHHLGHYAANFWPEDSTCIGWLSHLCCLWQLSNLQPAPIQWTSTWSRTCRPAIFMGCPIGLHRWISCWIPRWFHRKSSWPWKACFVGTPRRGFSSPFCFMFLFPLWLELNHGQHKHGSSLPMLALLRRSIP